MKKVLIIGCPGSGKSTFAKALHRKTALPLIHLDRLYWHADGTALERGIFKERLRDVLAQESWIIDGNYGSTLSMRLAACDTVFFLDYPTAVCLAGVLTRKGQARSDLPWIELSKDDDEEFLQLIRDYPQHQRPQVLDLLSQYPDKQQRIFNSRQAASEYLETLSS
ncbi:MAG: hypothetical protein Q4G44_05020 [Alcaligenaceae bacterium]|nr:hypothetical protein [Alcaligenaceae bacterium]